MMHSSLYMIADKTEEIKIEVKACERRRGIVETRRIKAPFEEDVLYVASIDELQMAVELPRHLVVLTNHDVPDRLSSIPNLGIIRSDDVAEACAEIARTLVSLSHWDARLLEAIATRRGVDEVLQIAAEQLDNPIALFDSRQALLSYAGSLSSRVGGTIWDEVLLNNFSPLEFFTHDEQKAIDQLSRSGWPYRIRPARNPENEYLCATITVDRQMVGSLGQVDVNKPFTQSQVAFTDLVCERLQTALALRLGKGPGADDASFLLRSILNGNRADRGLISYHLSKLGWEQGTSFRLLVMPLPEETVQNERGESRLARINRALHKALCILYENSVVALAPASQLDSESSLGQLLKQLGMRLVSSEPFSDVSDAPIAYEQCLLAASSLPLDEHKIASFSDAFETLFPAALEQAIDPRAVCNEAILDLAANGYKGNVERGRALVRELYVYLVRGCNSHRAARDLFLHRNTLVYHIAMMEQLLGCKFDELSTSKTLFLEISCLVSEAKSSSGI